MKVLLGTEPLGGYDQVVLEGWERVAPPANMSELGVADVLQFFPPDQAAALMGKWVQAVAAGAKVSVCGLDVLGVMTAVVAGELPPHRGVAALYGSGRPHRSAYHLEQVAELLERLGCRVTLKRFGDYRFVVEAIKRG